MSTDTLLEQIKTKQSFLCVGLDTDLDKIPRQLLDEEDPIFSFNKTIIDATHTYCVAYKPNIAFYEAYGPKGWSALKRTMAYINSKYPELFTIADAKRGDIGNTALRYARAFFDELGFDAITVAPYMGKDSVEPFLSFKDKHTILLALTSNEGASDFQTMKCGSGELYQKVIKTAEGYNNSANLMYVVGATRAEYLAEVRKLVPHRFLLVPGVGAQGGSLEEVCNFGMTREVGLLVNSSRGILYASAGPDYAKAAGLKAKELQMMMKAQLEKRDIR